MARNYRLIDAMAARGIGSEKLAMRVGLERKAVIRYRKGSMPKVDTALAIAQVLGVGVDELWEPSREGACGQGAEC